MANNVDMAVRLTDKATFALAREEKKLDILPPGQAEKQVSSLKRFQVMDPIKVLIRM